MDREYFQHATREASSAASRLASCTVVAALCMLVVGRELSFVSSVLQIVITAVLPVAFAFNHCESIVSDTRYCGSELLGFVSYHQPSIRKVNNTTISKWWQLNTYSRKKHPVSSARSECVGYENLAFQIIWEIRHQIPASYWIEVKHLPYTLCNMMYYNE